MIVNWIRIRYQIPVMLTSLIVGLIAGALGKFLMPGKDPGGFIITILLGLAGSFVGNIVGGLLPLIPDGEAGFVGRTISATIGAIILLALYRFIKKKKDKE